MSRQPAPVNRFISTVSVTFYFPVVHAKSEHSIRFVTLLGDDSSARVFHLLDMLAGERLKKNNTRESK